MVDLSTDSSYNLVFYAPAGTILRGNSAEWIVERPGVPSLTLADYAQAFFENMFAEDYSGHWSSPGYPSSGVGSYPLDMLDNAGAVISVSATDGPWDIWLQAQNSATQAGQP